MSKQGEAGRLYQKAYRAARRAQHLELAALMEAKGWKWSPVLAAWVPVKPKW